MDCPECQANNPSGQKFCGACGRKLESACAQCGAANPPAYKFCGNCGSTLADGGAVTLAPSGLITRVNQKALDDLGLEQHQMQGKPFSLFVTRPDLVIFFSHWNELLSTSRKQSFEISLNHRNTQNIFVRIESIVHRDRSGSPSEIQFFIHKANDSRLQSSRLQTQQDLLGVIFSVTHGISTVSQKHLDRAIEDALKKICLFLKADRSFIYVLNRPLKRLEARYEWPKPSPQPSDAKAARSTVPLAMIRRAIVRLRRENDYVINNVAQMAPAERHELQAWHQDDLGAVMCRMIYSGKRPVGVIGAAKCTIDGEWTEECVALVKFFGELISDRLPMTEAQKSDIEDPGPGPQKAPSTDPSVVDINTKRAALRVVSQAGRQESAAPENGAGPPSIPDISRPMLLEKLAGREVADQRPVFPRDDGLVLLTCPRCGTQESVTLARFDKLGNGIHVNCACGKQFAAVLEKRRSLRKSVRLDGYFTVMGDMGPADIGDNIWGPMVVQNLSKTGLRFSSERVGLIRNKDQLMVRFNLDNSNQALIHKPVTVISVNDREVGCRFEGEDRYDITLGFYFI